jgi:hypothetical protein
LNGSYPAEFESAWSSYPKREGTNSKRAAYAAWRSRILTDKIEPALLEAGANRYRLHMDAKGKLGSQYVMTAARFWGREAHYEEDWVVVEPQRTNGAASAEWDLIMQIVRRETDQPLASLTDEANTALKEVGGLSRLRMSNLTKLPWLRKEFISAYGAQ